MSTKSPFDWWDKNGKLVFHQDDVRIYNVDRQEHLLIGQTIFASTLERPWYIQKVLPHAKGRCLEIGLGLGCASKVILANPQTAHLLTIEKNPRVIEAFGRPLPRHHIVQADIYEWARRVPKTYTLYDLIFVDHYVYDEDLFPALENLAQDLTPLLKVGGHLIFWVDEQAPDEEKARITSLNVQK